ncbi:1-deoxy-D-xylulose-5-phosphate synthase [Aeromicrobium sp. 636]|uniref:1-deoxy-D-xylulose-5-phosphate synthase n=1 Tax=Aeromicrobium senzhongii TaxID=2663859 RepID=A0A8I0ETS5_9ACTN|nr:MULTISPECIES: 1-deoxy-D-xylulose-5-phosphate synthase [Aeromicrobium]MBC9224900.1 1-deoxy-D-xylulose-5-phosphate synthase [Aeromicrobium senzhongii]MCQ3997012.1 1-deoxy-D-xylulose-5-phosphate synthase [Aeromicrobium sp. 636]
MASVLSSVSGPADLRGLDDEALTQLAAEVRELLIESVAANGGHLGPNLGVVELTIALHRVFDSPNDKIVWDTGHQSYVHKMLTGRADQFAQGRLRKEGGLSGYPSQAESPHDWVENSHASTSLSYADGLARANAVQGKDDHVVAVIGDGALTGGMAWEAINNICADNSRRVVIVVNDNGRSYTPTVGGLANRLTQIRTNPRYEPALSAVRERMTTGPKVVGVAYEALHAIKKGFKDALAPQGLFEDLGIKYLGPIDGHDRRALEQALSAARHFGGPVLVHAITTKGHGYDIAVSNENDQMHQSHPFDRLTGEAVSIAPAGWTSVFRDEIVRIADDRPDVVGITAAMLYPTGLDAFADKFPDRVLDVGIAEQHAVTSAAGMAMGGLHPVVAVYATFLNRAFDQVLMDVALHRQGVTFVLDRAGVTGDDGASHNGMWDMSLMQIVPGLHLAAPRDGSRLRELLREAVEVADAPSVVRFAKGAVPADLEAIDRVGSMDVLHRGADPEVLVVGVGTMAAMAVEVARLLEDSGVGSTVVDPRWIKPLDPTLLDLAAEHRLVVTIEDNGRQGGVGSTILNEICDRGLVMPVRIHAVAQEFLDHAKRDVILDRLGLTPDAIAADALDRLKECPEGDLR